ncbi:unnamed protein product [Paramecium sonneborni]|uniref:Opioid growth factor receptor (OGFr) conserved domain-containing protein n=1 Tax=Paramecium sonneborni TaxID=65129 RepID=A0A8S1QBU6_9CILI|nr:unnamed protein product [Paramecium sonneborni]
MQSNKSEIYRNYDFYNSDNWSAVKPKIQDYIQQFQQQSKPQIDIKSFYQNLEYDHSFIQWMFPNFYASKFNPNSYKLTLEEREKMIKSPKILDRFYKNYKLILCFFGIKLLDQKIDILNNSEFSRFRIQQQRTIQKQQQKKQQEQKQKQEIQQLLLQEQQEQPQQSQQQQQQQQSQSQVQVQQQLQQSQVQQQEEIILIESNNSNLQVDQQNVKKQSKKLVLIDKSQFELCCLKNTHNLLRLKRILSSLSVLKHREDAILLCEFLKEQLSSLGKKNIYDQFFSGFDRYDEELSEKEKKNKNVHHSFNSWKVLYVDIDLIETVNISIIQ